MMRDPVEEMIIGLTIVTGFVALLWLSGVF